MPGCVELFSTGEQWIINGLAVNIKQGISSSEVPERRKMFGTNKPDARAPVCKPAQVEGNRCGDILSIYRAAQGDTGRPYTADSTCGLFHLVYH